MRIMAAAALLVLTGCASGDDDPAPTAAAETSDASPGTSSEAPSETPTDTPTETSTVAPATGPRLEVQDISVRVPKGYDVGYETPVVATARGPLGIVALVVIAGEQWSVDRLMKADLRAYEPVRDVERLPDTTLDGLPAFHYRGRLDKFYMREVYGTWDGGYQVIVRFDLHDTHTARQRRELAEAVVATYDAID